LEICDIIVRLLAVSVVRFVGIDECLCHDGALINALTLGYLMEECRSLKVLTLMGLQEMDEDHCRVLGAYSRPDLEIILHLCTITSAGASALTEVLGRNQGPTMLDDCDIDNLVLADGLRGNSRLKDLIPLLSTSNEVSNRQVLAIAGALRENKGLVDLKLGHRVLSYEAWGAICDSLKAHPTLEVLHVLHLSRGAFANPTISPAALNTRIQVLVDMLEVNMSIHTMHLDASYSQHELFRESVIPYLETNRFRPRVRAIQKTRPTPDRAELLGQALLATRTDANSYWMLLSGNVEVAFPSTTATIAAAATLPTPATAAAVSITNVDTAAAISSAPRATFTVSGSVAAPLSAGRKRMASSQSHHGLVD
jgi:hypothetical protein